MCFKSAQTSDKGKTPFFCGSLGREVGFHGVQEGELFCAALQVCKISLCIKDFLIYKKTNAGADQCGGCWCL